MFRYLLLQVIQQEGVVLGMAEYAVAQAAERYVVMVHLVQAVAAKF